RLAQRLERLVGGEAGSERGDFEQDAARLAEVHRPEPEAVDDRRRMHANRLDTLAPRLVLVHRRRPRDVVHGARAGQPALGRRRVVRDPTATLVADDAPAVVVVLLEAHALLEQLLAALRRRAVRADALEALQP